MHNAGISDKKISLNTTRSDLADIRDNFKFIVVRHPLDRLQSAYRNKVESYPPRKQKARASAIKVRRLFYIVLKTPIGKLLL